MTDEKRAEITVDLKGHFRQVSPQRLADVANVYVRSEIESQLASNDRFRRILDNGAEDELFYGHARCFICGDHVRLKKASDTVSAQSDCVYTSGVPKDTVLLDVPSGVIVFANDLRDLVDAKETGESVNSFHGRRLLSKAYADVGMIHLFVGNSCPDVLRLANEILVARLPFDIDMAEDRDRVEVPGSGQAELMGNICTDLWWFSAMDKDHFLERCRIEGRNADELLEECLAVPVDPATYAFSIEDDEEMTWTVFSRITTHPERVPLVTKPINPLEDFRGAFLQGDCLYRGLAHFFFILTIPGNGIHWVHGKPSYQSRSSDMPFRRLDEEAYGHPLIEHVPVSPLLFHTGTLHYSLDYPDIVCGVPREVSPYWLALCMIFAKTHTTTEADNSATRPEQPVPHQVAPFDILRRALDMHCEIADARDLWNDLRGGIFDEVLTIIGSEAA